MSSTTTDTRAAVLADLRDLMALVDRRGGRRAYDWQPFTEHIVRLARRADALGVVEAAPLLQALRAQASQCRPAAARTR